MFYVIDVIVVNVVVVVFCCCCCSFLSVPLPLSLFTLPQLTWAAFHDMNSLYGSSLMSKLPFRKHRLMDKINQSPKFKFLAEKLMSLDLEYFKEKVVKENMTYYCTVVINYDFEASLSHSLDLSMFPTMQTCKEEDLTADQRAYLRDNKRNISKAPPKLVSLHQNGEWTDFVTGILYLCFHHSCQVVDVLSIMEFECADLMSPWLGHLQHNRAKATSNIESKLYKNLANVISGKLHQVGWVLYLSIHLSVRHFINILLTVKKKSGLFNIFFHFLIISESP